MSAGDDASLAADLVKLLDKLAQLSKRAPTSPRRYPTIADIEPAQSSLCGQCS
jgi:hypothetical protein